MASVGPIFFDSSIFVAGTVEFGPEVESPQELMAAVADGVLSNVSTAWLGAAVAAVLGFRLLRAIGRSGLAGRQLESLAGAPGQIGIGQPGVERVGLLRVGLPFEVEGEVFEEDRLEPEPEAADIELSVVIVAGIDVGQVELQTAAEVERLEDRVVVPLVEAGHPPAAIVATRLTLLRPARRRGPRQ